MLAKILWNEYTIIYFYLFDIMFIIEYCTLCNFLDSIFYYECILFRNMSIALNNQLSTLYLLLPLVYP